MFTGIIEELGVISKIERREDTRLIKIEAHKVTEGTKIGDSISVNGVCLTVVDVTKNFVAFEAISETLKATNLNVLSIGQKVNLERSLKVGDRLSGHFVLGHIDCLGVVRKKSTRNGNIEFEIAIPPTFTRYCLPKGSIALDGISLTLADIRANIIKVCIIPHTLRNTTLYFKGPSDKLNVEFDILAKKS